MSRSIEDRVPMEISTIPMADRGFDSSGMTGTVSLLFSSFNRKTLPRVESSLQSERLLL